MIDGMKLLQKFHSFKDQREGGKYLASLSSREFDSILKLPYGFPRVYLCAMRRSFQSSNRDKYIIHIPHASLEVPKTFICEELTISYSDFQRENIFISDYLVDKFVSSEFTNVVKFKYSRMYCDVERYLDDSKEEMSKYGMGVLYTKDSNGKEFVNRGATKKWAIDSYREHHDKLDNMVSDILKKKGECFIIDLHSFSDEFVYKMFNKKNNPDICIGINKNNYNKKILVETISHFKKYGYTVKINYPYSGSIIPNRFPEVNSMMIEINKRVYLSNIKDYHKLYNCFQEYYKMLRRF